MAGHRTSPGGRLAGLALCGALLAGVMPLALVWQVPDTGRSPAWLLTAAVMVWAGLRLAGLIVSGAPRLFDLVFWLSAYVFMGLAPTVQIRADLPSRTTPGMDPGVDLPTAAVVWAGLLAYEAGQAWARRRAARAPLPEPAAADATAAGRAALLVAIGLLAAAYYTSRIGVPTLFASRYTAFAIRSEVFPDLATRSVLTAAATYPLLIATGVLARSLRNAPSRAVRWGILAALAVVVPVLLVMSNPISSARYEAGTVLFALAVLAGAMGTRLRARLSMLAVVAAFLLVFPIADAFRTDEVSLEREGFFAEYAANPDYDAFWQIGNTLTLLRESGLEPGRQLLGVVLFWVPRALWADKPVDTGTLLAQHRGYAFENLSAPLWAELLVNGAVPAVLVGFAALGLLLRRLDDQVAPALLGGGRWWAVAGAVLPFYMVILLRGSLLQATGALAVLLACLVWVRARPGRHRPDPLPARGRPQRAPYAAASRSATAAMLNRSRTASRPAAPILPAP